MEKQSKPAPEGHLLALRCAKASLLLASFRMSRAPPPSCRRSPSSSSPAAVDCCTLRSDGLIPGEVATARREATEHARIAGSDLLLVLTVAPLVLLLFLLLGLLAETP